ncbi:MAG: hypothetical protein L6Q78_10960 [Bacteroidia bacterium]|nr:hypothetical protein [Bacteroidia bacterium]
MILTEQAFQKIAQISSSFKFSQISNYAATIEGTFLKNLFGKNLLDYLDGLSDPKDLDLELIGYIQAASGNFALTKALPKLLVTLTGSGALQADNNAKKPLYEWQKIELENELLESGWRAIDDALILLSSNSEEFEPWRESDHETAYWNNLFLSAYAFDAYFPISSSRRTLEALKGCILDVLNLKIKPLLRDNYSTFLDARKVGNLTPDADSNMYQIAPLIYATAANLAIEQALFKMEFTFSDDGVRVTSVSASSEKAKIKSMASMDMKREMASRCQQTGSAYYYQLKAKCIELGLITDTTEVIDNSTGSSFIL